MAKTARDVMTQGVECAGENETVADAARKFVELDVGAMPICGEDDRLKGMLTDRDFVVEVIAKGKDPASVKAGELGGEEVVTIGADDSVEEVLSTLKDHKVRPVAKLEERPAAPAPQFDEPSPVPSRD
ncbi:MAG: CBS domain-containing protein [Thermoleophilaceae bacterium]